MRYASEVENYVYKICQLIHIQDVNIVGRTTLNKLFAQRDEKFIEEIKNSINKMYDNSR